MTTILFPDNPFVYLYTGLPFFTYSRQKEITLTSDLSFVEQRDKNRSLILLRWFHDQNPHRPTDEIGFLTRLRDKYDRIAIFEDEDSTSSSLLVLLPYVDIFWKKQIFKDRTNYLKSFQAHRIFSDFYQRTRGLPETDETPFPIADASQLSKIRPAWHLGIGIYPVRHWKDRLAALAGSRLGNLVPRLLAGKRPQRLAVFDHTKLDFCQGRYAVKGYSPLVAYQREFFAEILRNQPSVKQGFIDRKTYREEMGSAAAVVSPFGWGEVCYRDFEAFQLGSVLIKPSMEHMESWPDSYQPGITYASVAWDGSDLIETIRRVLDDRRGSQVMTENAYDTWATAFHQLDTRVASMLAELG